MFKTSKAAAANRLPLLLLGCCCLLAATSVRARSLAPLDLDPMLALPSGQQQQEVHYVYQTQPEQQPVVEYQLQTMPPKQSAEYSAPEGYQYVQVAPEAGPQQQQQQQQPQQQQSETASCNQKNEYVSLASLTGGEQASAQRDQSAKEYPGEIVYVSSQGEQSEQQEARAQMQESDLPSMLVQNSGLPATILTEIPMRDLPADVLNKLRKDYGVKVVATRERPGANLVINCDEYSNRENSICSRSASSEAYGQGYGAQPGAEHPEAYGEQPAEQPAEYQTAEQEGGDRADAERTYEREEARHQHRSRQEGGADGQDAYGARTTPSADQNSAEPAQPEAEAQPEPNQGSGAEARGHENAGFDEQPKRESEEGEHQTSPSYYN